MSDNRLLLSRFEVIEDGKILKKTLFQKCFGEFFSKKIKIPNLGAIIFAKF